MAGIRAGMAVLVAALAFAPAAAWACEEPREREEVERVEGFAGETVSVAIPNTLEGAKWVIRVDEGDDRGEEDEHGDDGEKLAEGEDGDEAAGVEAELEIPDLGEAARTVELLVEVVHAADDSRWSYPLVLRYQGRSAPEPAEPPSRSEPAPAPVTHQDPAPPAPERSASAAPAEQPPPAAAPRSAPAQAPPAPAESFFASPPPAVAPPRSGPAVGTMAELATPAREPDVGARRIGGEPAPAALASQPRPGRAVQPKPHASTGYEPRPRRYLPFQQGGTILPDIELPAFGSGVMWGLIGGGAVAFLLAGLGVAGIGRHRRRGGLAPG